jgi:hypothetical protein
MNTMFVVVGVLTSAGAVLTRGIWPRRRVTSVGVAIVVLAGVGGILVGLAAVVPPRALGLVPAASRDLHAGHGVGKLNRHPPPRLLRCRRCCDP